MPPRRQPPPPAGESKTGLVVALVVFVLLTIVSGALAYMFYAENAKAEDARKAAVAHTAKMKEERNAKELRRIPYAIYVGDATPTDRENFNTLKSDAKTYGPELAKFRGELEKLDVKWNAGEEKPVDSMIDLIGKRNNEL